MMKTLDDIIYYTCCAVVVLHSLSAILVVTHGRCSVYAAAFLIACVMWINLSVLNLWFFLPSAVQVAAHIRLGPATTMTTTTTTGAWRWAEALVAAREILLSRAASYLLMMLFGWFVGSMSLSNALSMWRREGCDAVDLHHHGGLAGWLIRAARWAEEIVGIEDEGQLLGLTALDARTRRSRRSWVFAVPRGLYTYYLFILSPPVKLLGERRRELAAPEKS